MYRSIIILIILNVFVAAASAQKVKSVESVAQSWSGGVAGRYGCNYTFIVSFTDYVNEAPVPDTFWIENEPVALDISDSSIIGHNTLLKRSKGSATYEIHVQTEHNENENNPYRDPREHKKSSVHPPIPIKGVGLVSYKYRGKENYFEVSKITAHLKPIAYP